MRSMTTLTIATAAAVAVVSVVIDRMTAPRQVED